MPNASAAAAASASSPVKKSAASAPEKKYKCQFCSRAFSRSEHRSRHERSHTKERPFKCMKCRSTFVRRDLLLRHDRTVHAKDGGAPLVSEVKRRNTKTSASDGTPSGRPGRRPSKQQPPVLDPATLEQIEASSDGMVDLETAAMLITDLHHKATARNASGAAVDDHHHRRRHREGSIGESSGEAADGDPSTPYSPEHTTMFDHGVGYLNNANMPLPGLPWDSFMSHSVNAPSSYASPSSSRPYSPPLPPADALRLQAAGLRRQPTHASQLPFNGGTAGALHAGPGASGSLMERFPSSNDALNPALAAVDGSLPASGAATPNGHPPDGADAAGGDGGGGGTRGLSPFPFLLGPVSPVDYRRSPGPSQALVSPRIPQIGNDEAFEALLQRIRDEDAGGEIPAAFTLAHWRDANEYLGTYFALFHHHLPFLHPESFDAAAAAPALLVAALSIGALYALDQERAFQLHVASKVLVNRFLQGKEEFSSRKCPLWLMQATLLNMIFASWSGDRQGLEWACSIKSLLANMVAGNKYELQLRTDARGDRPATHAEWIEDEGCRRTYYAVYIFFGLLTLTYNHTPALSYDEFADLALPSSESLWNLPHADEEAWREALAASGLDAAHSVRVAHDALFNGEAARYSALATRVMIAALFLEVWAHTRRPETLQDVVTEYRLRLALETWDRSLELCAPETLVVPPAAHAAPPPAPPPSRGATRGSHPLIFNALAVYRTARARLEVDLKPVQEALRYHDPYEVAAAMTGARERVRRGQEMIRVAEECFEGLEGLALQGLRPGSGAGVGSNGGGGGGGGGGAGRAAATGWSVEHPLCGCDLLVVLSLWLYRLEHDAEPASEEELAVYHRLRNLLDDDAVESGQAQLSATVARLWGEMLDEVVVWGITKLMGESFKLHSQALSGHDDAAASASAASTPPMSPAHAPAPELEIETAVY